MNKFLYLLSLAVLSTTASAQSTDYTKPAGSVDFGNAITVLTNGNYVITDPSWGATGGGNANRGAVYLYNGSTNALISTLTGTKVNDQVGSGGITVLNNGNYVVRSPLWDATVMDVGAVTWCSGSTGITGAVTGGASGNSLVGSKLDDRVGSGGIIALSNGNYVVKSPLWDGTVADVGAVTWGNGTTAGPRTVGAVTSSNSLVGGRANDKVGSGGITELAYPSNVHFAVSSPDWNAAANAKVGAVTWCNGNTTGTRTTSLVAISNSLVGSKANDRIGSGGITVLTDGHYVVSSPDWDGTPADVGAVTWCNRAGGTMGAVTATISLVGGTLNDRVGNGGVTALPNGNYVVRSSDWDGVAVNTGAVTWGNGATVGPRTVGFVTGGASGNSLVGSALNDKVGSGGITALTNGNYVVSSPDWNNGSIADVGAVTWGSGTAGVKGAVTGGASGNSLVGSQDADAIGLDSVTALSNGNYVVSSSLWSNGTVLYAGAVTWGDGSGGTTGAVTSSNSLVGSQEDDQIGSGGVTALISNGNYVVNSPTWKNGINANAGAATWGNGATAGPRTTGSVSNTNSIVGGQEDDKVGSGSVTALTNGNYVVSSPEWSSISSIIYAGAATWGNGTTGTTGLVSSANSVVGGQDEDYVGFDGILALRDGNYLVRSSYWNNGINTYAGAVTWGNGTAGISGIVSSTNSLVGSTASDQVGVENANSTISVLSNGKYIVRSSDWDNGSLVQAGAVTWGAVGGTTGPVTSCNSVVGNVANSFLRFDYNNTAGRIIITKSRETIFSVFTPVEATLVTATSTATNTASGITVVPFVNSACKVIAALVPAGTAPVSGSVTAKVYVQTTAPSTTGGTAYVRRHYDILPATGANTATAGVILYFTQADFDDYNSNNGTAADLPADPTDATGKAALRVTQQHGTSTTGLPGSYTGGGLTPANVLITPGASNVVWNAALSRWEVSFNVTGFSGFFVSGGNTAPLPVNLLDFAARTDGNRNRLDWNTATETEGVTFEITRSADGSKFEKIGTLAGKSGSAVYTFYDEQPLDGINYYRLNIVEPSGEQVFSNVVLVKRNALSGGITVSPIPAGNTLTITNSNAALAGSTVTALDMQGRVMATETLETSTQIDIQNWPAGIYMLKFADGSVVKVVKQ